MKQCFKKVLAFSAFLIMVQSASAQFSLGNILGGIKDAVTTKQDTTTTSTSNSETTSKGGGLLSGLSSLLGLGSKDPKEQIIGTWVYEEPAVVFNSDNILENAGGKLASAAIEKKLSSYLEKHDIKKGKMTMTFDKDGNFTQVIGKRTLEGTYTIEDKNIKLMYSGKIAQTIGTTQLDGNNLLIVMDATKLLKYAKALGSYSSNTTIKTASSILGNMDGMECGIRLVKK